MKEQIPENLWGMELSVDLHKCNPIFVSSEVMLKEFLVAICKEIDAKPYGDPVAVRFGDREDICGYSVFQLIETSNISGHFVEKTNSAYINIFSCKAFDYMAAMRFTRDYFEAKDCSFNIVYRKI